MTNLLNTKQWPQFDFLILRLLIHFHRALNHKLNTKPVNNLVEKPLAKTKRVNKQSPLNNTSISNSKMPQ
jgi:hypothetical protein